MAVSIIIADDFPALRTGARTWLELHPDLQVIGEANDGLAGIRLVRRMRPDILVTDVHMPGLNGMEVVRSTRNYAPDTRVVVWSPNVEEEFLLEALRGGALGYVLKTSPAEVLVKAVRLAARGNHFLDPHFTQRQPVEAYLKTAREGPGDLLETLTTREKEVLHFVANGSSSAEIGHELHISPRTVEQHRARMMRKLLLRNQTDLIRLALRRGIMSWQD